MVQTALSLLSQALSASLSLAVPLLVGLAVLFTALLLFAFFDRGRFHEAARWVGRRGLFLGQWALALLALGASILGIDIAHRSVETRFGSQINARYTNSADPNTSETVQQAPTATYLSQRTYTRTLVIPPDLLRQVRREGVQVLAPYLQDPTSANIVRLKDQFTRSGQDVVFSRQATLQTQEYITLDKSKVEADLNFVDAAGGRQSYYNASFGAQYTFRNPLSSAATIRFAFPLPSGSGTLSGFTMTVNGRPYTAADLSAGSVWEGVVPPGAGVDVRVTYKHQGSKGWNYDLSQRLEPVKSFDLTIRADQPAKFQRYSLFPTSTEGGAFGGKATLRWQLQNAITAQNVAVVFEQGSVRETLAKLYAFAPFSLLLGVLLLLVWAAVNRLPLSPLRLALALLGLSLGFSFGGVLTGYLPPLWAELLGAALGLTLALLSLGLSYWPPLVLVVLAPLTFLSVGNAGLLLGLLAALTLVLLRARATAPPPVRVSAESHQG
ncbi:hypothetical protein Q0M94_09965 [Deinococcus radiomollis]|uniref:hypothetical protein n=1 Tax=Deinococcus radiomollis TaxID=468916 RepID=UPI0038925C59